MADIEEVTGGTLAPSPGEPNPAPNFGTGVPSGRVRMSAVGSTSSVEAWVDGPVIPGESGYGGWTVTEEEGAKGTLEFSGVEPLRWTLPILVDGWSGQVDVQHDWDLILALAAMVDDQPPEQVMFAGTVPHDLSGRAWLIEKQAPGSTRLITQDGEGRNALLRAYTTLSLIEPVFARNIASPFNQARSRAKGLKAKRTIRARKGDTLVKIAGRELGNPARWKEISKLNGNLQPDNVKAGQKIKLP